MEIKIDIIRKERLTRGGEKLYPVHMEDWEIFSIIDYLLENYSLYGRSIVLAYIRKDRGAKGVDFCIRVHMTEEGEAYPVRQYAFGINSNWEVEGFFDHWVSSGNGFSAEEIASQQIPVLEQILRDRIASGRPVVRNRFFDGDGWACVYEQSNMLSN